MAKPGTKAVALARKPRSATPIVVRNVPKGHNWGWYSREDPRVHLQIVDEPPHHKVWLEARGKRVFEPVGNIPSKLLKPLHAYVQEHRQAIEGMWVRFMLDKRWLTLHVDRPKVTLVAYPNTPNTFRRVIDLTSWFDQEQLATLRRDLITLDREMAALRLWSHRPEEQVPYDARLSTLLWTGPLDV